MRIKKILLVSFGLMCFTTMFSQNSSYVEVNADLPTYQSSRGFGNTLNLGLGLSGYLGNSYYNGHSLPVLDINYEFGVSRDVTLAPFVSYYSYTDNNYREIVTPVGLKGTFYLDELLRAGSHWDFYVAGSLGVALTNTTWDDNYDGTRTYYQKRSPLYIDLHVGAEYHLSRRLGIFLDFSSGISTVGLALH